MKCDWKRYFPITLMIWPYLYIFSLYMLGEYASNFPIMLSYSILTIVLYVAHMLHVYRGKKSFYQLAFWNMVIKVFHIPFYIFILILQFVFMAIAVVPAFIIVSPIIVFLLFFIECLLMIVSSMYGVNALIRARRKKLISTKYMILHGVLHFILIIDVISAIFVFIKLRRQKCINK